MIVSCDRPPGRSSAQRASRKAAAVQRGSAILEAALFMPIIFALFIGMEELARVTYNYYMIQKTLAGLARYLGTQQGVNFCNGADPILTAAINNALTGTTDASGAPADRRAYAGHDPGVDRTVRPGGAAAQSLRLRRARLRSQPGRHAPGYIVVSLANGYTVRPLFWGFNINPFPLQPSVTVPYGGT